MKKKKTGRSTCGALVAILALAALGAAPAGAAPPTAKLTGGTLRFVDLDQGNLGTVDVAPAVVTCPADDIELDFPTATTSRVKKLVATRVVQRNGAGPLYRMKITATNAPVAGTAAGASPAGIDIDDVDLTFEIHDTTLACGVGEVAVCSLTTTVDLDGSYSGNPAAPAMGDTFSLTVASEALSSTGCGVPWSMYIDGFVIAVVPNRLVFTYV